MTIYYLDTSIWLDLFEDRDEPNLPKSKLAKNLISKIIQNKDEIIFTEIILDELNSLGYSEFEIENLILINFKEIIIYIPNTKIFANRARDIANKRNIPFLDALHALIARDQKAILITRDNHFNKLLDIIKPKKPEEVI